MNESLRKIIDHRFFDGWTQVCDRLCYWEPTKNSNREIAIGNEGKIVGGPLVRSEASLATTFGVNSEEVMGNESFGILNQEDHSEYVSVA